jgi:hypothetical protein
VLTWLKNLAGVHQQPPWPQSQNLLLCYNKNADKAQQSHFCSQQKHDASHKGKKHKKSTHNKNLPKVLQEQHWHKLKTHGRGNESEGGFEPGSALQRHRGLGKQHAQCPRIPRPDCGLYRHSRVCGGSDSAPPVPWRGDCGPRHHRLLHLVGLLFPPAAAWVSFRKPKFSRWQDSRTLIG